MEKISDVTNCHVEFVKEFRMQEGGLNLRKWKSNNVAVRKYIANCEEKENICENINNSVEETYVMFLVFHNLGHKTQTNTDTQKHRK